MPYFSKTRSYSFTALCDKGKQWHFTLWRWSLLHLHNRSSASILPYPRDPHRASACHPSLHPWILVVVSLFWWKLHLQHLQTVHRSRPLCHLLTLFFHACCYSFITHLHPACTLLHLPRLLLWMDDPGYLNSSTFTTCFHVRLAFTDFHSSSA